MQIVHPFVLSDSLQNILNQLAQHRPASLVISIATGLLTVGTSAGLLQDMS